MSVYYTRLVECVEIKNSEDSYVVPSFVKAVVLSSFTKMCIIGSKFVYVLE